MGNPVPIGSGIGSALGSFAGPLGTLAGGLIGSLFDSSKSDAKRQERLQLAFAKNAIQWKVADATKAGIHPLYALGAPTMSYSPVSVGGGSAMSDMGQDISRALAAGMPREGQVSAYDLALQDLTLKQFGLQNELLAAQVARARQEVLSKPALPGVTTLPFGQGKIPMGPQSSAQSVQDKYGDIVENVYGLWSVVDDIQRWLTGPGKGVPSRGPKAQTGYLYGKTGRR